MDGRRIRSGAYLLTLVITVVACAAMGACGGSTRPEASSSPHQSQVQSPATSAVDSGLRTVSLRCGDANDHGPNLLASDVGRKVGPVLISGAPETGEIPLARTVGLRMTAATFGWRFLKAPLVVAAGRRDVRISITGAGQALLWVRSADWTGPPPVDVRRWLAKAVVIHPCPGQDAAFLGGIAAERTDSCIIVRVAEAGQASTTRFRLDGGGC